MSMRHVDTISRWGIFVCATAIVVIVWTDFVLAPLAVSDSLVFIARSHDDANVFADVADVLRNSKARSAVPISFLIVIIVLLNALPLWQRRRH